MEAKDTVMSEEQIGEGAVKVKGLYYAGGMAYLERLIAFSRKMTKAQAEISFRAGYKQAREEMDIQLASLAELCLNHRNEGREEGLKCIKGEIEKVENDYRDDDDMAQYLAFNKAKQKILALFKEKEGK